MAENNSKMKPAKEKVRGHYKNWTIAVTWRTALGADNKIFQIWDFRRNT
jgi:hypothetical protein